MKAANNVISLPRKFGVRWQPYIEMYGVMARGDRQETFHTTFEEARIEYVIRSSSFVRKANGAGRINGVEHA